MVLLTKPSDIPLNSKKSRIIMTTPTTMTATTSPLASTNSVHAGGSPREAATEDCIADRALPDTAPDVADSTATTAVTVSPADNYVDGTDQEILTQSNHRVTPKSPTSATPILVATAPISTTENKKPLEATNSNQQDSQQHLKIKRCRHGRIIVKDLSKKKPVQQGDNKEINNRVSAKALEIIENRQSTSEESTNYNLKETDVADGVTTITSPLSSIAVEESTNNHNDLIACDSKSDNPVEGRLKSNDDSPAEASESKQQDKSPSPNRQSKTSKSPTRRPVSRSPTHRRSPRRDRSKSPRRRHRNRSPRRSDRSRSPKSARSRSRKSELKRTRSRNRSPKRGDRCSPISYRANRQSSRNKSPRCLRDSSRSRSRSRSVGRLGNSIGISYKSASPRRDSGRRDRFAQDHDRIIRRNNVFDKSPSDHSLGKEVIANVTKAADSLLANQFMSEKRSIPKQAINTHDGSKTQLHKYPLSNQSQESKFNHETAQPPLQGASPRKTPSSRSSPASSSDNSPSSDIYDPEGPIIPMSPGDSPPLSPIISAAKNNYTSNNINNNNNSSEVTYHHDTDKNDDDVPSSAVQLNHQEKYLQKLNRQERVIDEVKVALKPHYRKRAISKEQYKDVLRRAVPKICHSKNGEINPVKVRALVEAYVRKMKRRK